MPGYRFYPAADLAQDKIWRYTADTWGEPQAEKYILGLHEHLTRLASSKSTWRRLPPYIASLPGADENIFVSRYRHHLIFFRELPTGKIGILTLLHEKSDLPKRLTEDLRRVGVLSG